MWPLFRRGLRVLMYHKVSSMTGDALTVTVAEFKRLGITPTSVLAYPYGGRPPDSTRRTAMKRALRDAGVQAAFRIGNRVNAEFIRDPFEINRLDVRGDRSFGAFQRKVSWGK